jgi:type IV pilus assembly protein PilC
MSNFSYVALDARGLETRGILDVTDQGEALRRIKEMGLFPTRVVAEAVQVGRATATNSLSLWRRVAGLNVPGLGGRIRPAALAVFTRNLATLIEAGMPLLRGLRTLQDQEENRLMRQVLRDLSAAIESGNPFSDALALHPRIFNRLYVNMVKAGELGGALDLTLHRLADFMEKAQRLKSRIQAALFYPCAVLFVAAAVVGVMIAFVIPRFRLVFDGLLGGADMPVFTSFVFGLSEQIRNHLPHIAIGALAMAVVFRLVLRTNLGRATFDRFKLAMPVLGTLLRKVAISRFARTLGTLAGSGVPLLQALTILKETAGNVLVRNVIANVHDRVKEGEPIAPTLKGSAIFPAMVAGMVDVGEQTGALPEMLNKIAERCDEEVDQAATALTSLLEPVLLVFLAVVVGSIVIAMFLPLLIIMDRGFDRGDPGDV